MIEVKTCVVCGGALISNRRGVVAPFLAARIWQRRPFAVNLSCCGECGFEFFNPRLEPAEESRLYAGYRGPEYLQMRFRFEPWYSAKFNEGLSSAGAWQHRIRLLRELFARTPELATLHPASVLDFGGEHGDLIAGLFPGAKLYVYDISGAHPAKDVQVLHTLGECRRYEYDLIVTSNVLEHVGFPRELMAQITSLARKDTVMFNEVPCEDVSSLQTRAKRLAQAAMLLLKRPTIARSLARPGLFALMHEHVNYFSPRALAQLVELSGFRTLAQGKYVVSTGLLGGSMLWNLAAASSVCQPHSAGH